MIYLETCPKRRSTLRSVPEKGTPEILPYEENGFEVSRHPDDFGESIIMTTEKLKREISELYEEYGFKR